MTPKRDHLVLGLAFAAALALHAVALPWVGAAVGEAGQQQVDLKVTAFEADGFARAGDSISTHADVVESSGGEPMRLTRDDRRDTIWLSRDRSVSEDDVSMIDLRIPGVPQDDPQSEADALNPRVETPADADGPYWLIYQADVDKQVPDRDRSNNTRAVPIFIDGPERPELAIDRFETPERAIPGGAIAIDYTVTNTGKGWANTKTGGKTGGDAPGAPNWIDRVYLSEDDRLDETDVPLRSFDRTAPLGPGDRYRHDRVALAVPPGLTGEAHLILAADADQRLDQPSFTEGLVVRPIELVDTSTPDLVVAGIDELDRLVIGRPSPVRFTIANVGNAEAGEAWFDGVYLSPEPVLDSRSIPLEQFDSGQPLPPRSRYRSEVPVTLPEGVEPGQWYLVVKADASRTIDEPGFEDNNTAAIPVTVLSQKQADAEIQLGKPDNPERLVVQWIEHDRAQEHIARLSRTVQPALQDKADPTPDAPLEFFPEPPAIARQPASPAGNPSRPDQPADPEPSQDARPNPAAPDPSQTDQAPRPQDPSSQPNERIDGPPGDDGQLPAPRPGIDQPLPPNPPTPPDPNPGKDTDPSPRPGDEKIDAPPDPDAPQTDSNTDSDTPADIETDTDQTNPDESPSKQPTDQPDPAETDQPTEQADPESPVDDPSEGDSDTKTTDKTTTPQPADDDAPQPEGKPDQPSETSEEKNPTRAPRDDSEAPPTNNRKVEVELQEGRVLVGEGVEVTTKLPTMPGIGARRLSLPRNARVSVTFNNKGEVHEAKILRTTTYKEWDAAIEASLYRWSARGKAIDNAQPHITIEWDYILNELLDSEVGEEQDGEE